MSAPHPGVTLRVAARLPLTEAQVVEVIEGALQGALVEVSPGRWLVNGGLGWVGEALIQRQPWGEGEGWQLDWTLSARGLAHGRAHGRYLGEPWMLQAALALRALSDAAVVSITPGQGWEPGALDVLASLNLPRFEGAVALDDVTGAAAQSLARARGGWAPGLRVGAGSTWVASEGWCADAPWGPWPAQGAPPALPWAWAPLPDGLEEADDADTLYVDGFGPDATSAHLDADADADADADDEALARFTRAVIALGGQLAKCPRVMTASGRVAIPEDGLRLALCAQRERLCGAPAPLSASALLRADALAVARLQRDTLDAVYWQAPEGEVTLAWSRAGHTARHITLAFSRPADPSGDPWRGEPWQLGWVEAFAAAFDGLAVIAAGHHGGWLPRFAADEDPDQFALALRRDAASTWHGRCDAGWFGRAQGVAWSLP